jgi:hypothetical protein
MVQGRLRRTPGDPIASFTLATLDRFTWRHGAAEARFATIEKIAPPRLRAWTLLGHGATLAQRWDSAGAPLLARAAALADSIGEPEAAAHARLALARFAARFVRPDSIAHLVAQARRLAPASDSALTALAMCAEATVIRTRNLTAADSLARSGAELAQAARDPRAEARCLLTGAQIAEARGLQVESLAWLIRSGRAHLRTADTDLGATIDQLVAYHFVQFTFALAGARSHARRALARADSSGNRVAAGYARLNLAQLAIRLGDFRNARHQLDTAETVLASLGDRAGLAARDFVAGDAALALGRLAEADGAYRSSLVRYRALGNPVTQVLLRLAQVAAERKELARADSLQALVTGDAERFNLLGIKRDLIYFGALSALRRGRYAEAAAEFSRYRTMAAAGAFLYRLDAGIREAEALALGGKLTEAELTADSAFALLEAVRTSVAARRVERVHRDALMSMASNRRLEFDPDLGVATLVHSLAQGGRIDGAFRLADAERARTLWVRLARRGMLSRDTADPASWNSITYPDDTPLEALRARLDSRTAILAFTGGAGGEPTTLFVLDRARLQARSLPPTDSLAAPIQRFVDQIEGGGYPRALARDLGRRLLDSALAGLPGHINRLVIIPDGPLFRLPFDALITPDGRALVERYATSTALSARLAVEWLGRPPRAAPGRVVAFGDPRFDAAARLARLPGAAREARNAAGRDGVTHLGADASETELRTTDWTGVSVLHLATHARTEDWGILTSAVYLAPGRSDDGRLGPDEIAATSFPVDLVVLSGCRTTGGVVVFGEGIQGLVAPFLEAGARAVLATYWDVGDRRMLPLLDRFYRELRSGATAGDALQTAKRAALAGGQPPMVWAGFGLTGEAGVRPLGPRAP